MTMKYILVTGGVISGIGKGVIASSIGVLLKSFALRVTSIKIDPYINIDAGTFSPYEHGEVYVLDDGGEVDLDLGNYERFLNITLTKDNNITTGKVYKEVIDKERRGDYLGKTVQIIPHITDAIQDWVERVARIPVDTRNRTDSAATDDQKVPQVCVIELGGTIGDIEGMPFVEAFRQFARRAGKDNFCNVHVSLVPQPKTTGEHKTKPTQVSVRELRALGLSPDLIICRSETPINDEVQKKISNFCHVEPKEVVCIHDRSSIYRVPLALHEQNLAHFFANKLALSLPLHPTTNLLDQFEHLADLCDNLHREVTIALVGKYTKLQDSYASVIKSLQHSALSIDHKLNLMYIEAEALEESYKQIDEVKHYEAWQSLCKSNGVLVPGGFGDRGIEGKIRAIEWARVNKKPFLGICLGLQCAVIEFARNVLKWPNANSTEVDPNCETAVVIDMPEHHKGDLGGTMRLGKRTTKFRTNVKSKLRQLYGNVETVDERHRHRYEVNNKLVDEFEKFGMHFVGHDDTGERMEIMELEDHPYFVGVQYHPEYLSRPVKPSPPFKGLVLAASGKLECHLKGEFSKGRPSPRLFSDESSANASDSDSDFSLINRA